VNLPPSTPFVYRVREVYAANSSANSTTASATTGAASAGLPVVTGVSSTAANGGFNAGATIPITVTFSRDVAVTGTPLLALNDGGVGTYVSGSASNILTFNYTVAAGQNKPDLDYIATGALLLNGGTIKAATGSPDDAVLTLARPARAGIAGVQQEPRHRHDRAARSLRRPVSADRGRGDDGLHGHLL
jgi:hypothetical protein